MRGVRDWECCVKRVQANQRDKRGCGCIECAGGVSVSEATSKPHFPPSPSGLYGRRRYTGEGNCDIVILLEKREVEDFGRKKRACFWTGCSCSPLPVLTTRCAVGDITQNKGVLKARNEQAETSFAITFETGPNASLRPTIVHRLLVFLDEAFRLKSEKEEGQKNRTRRHKSAATMFPQNRPPVSKATLLCNTRFRRLLSYFMNPLSNITCVYDFKSFS